MGAASYPSSWGREKVLTRNMHLVRIVERAIPVIPEIVTIKLETFFWRECLIENRRLWAGSKNCAETLKLAFKRLKKPSGLRNRHRIIIWAIGKSTFFFIIFSDARTIDGHWRGGGIPPGIGNDR